MKEKILLLHQGGDLYGSDKIFLSIAKTLSNDYSLVVLLDHKGPLVNELKPYTEKVIVRNLGVLRRNKRKIEVLYEVLKSLPEIYRLIKRHNPKYIVTNTSVVISGALVAKMKGIEHVWFVHEEPQLGFEQIFFKNIINLLSDNVVCPSRSVRSWLGGKAKVIPYIEEIKDTKKSQKNKLSPKKNTVLGCIGMLHPKKGQHYLIDVFEKVVDEHKKTRLLIIGGETKGYEGYVKNLKEKVRKKGQSKQVKFLGYKRNVYPYFKLLDALIIPSQYEEPFPLVAQEAMFFGKPIFATKKGGLKELVIPGKNGAFIPQNNSSKAAGIILDHLRDKEKLSKMGGQARKIYEEKFDYNRFEEKVRSLFS